MVFIIAKFFLLCYIYINDNYDEQLELMNQYDKGNMCIGDEIEGEVASKTNEGIIVSIPGYGKDGIIKYNQLTAGDDGQEYAETLNKMKQTMAEIAGVDATAIATADGKASMANMIMLGALLKATGIFTLDEIRAGVEKTVPPSKQHLVDVNMEMIEKGYNL